MDPTEAVDLVVVGEDLQTIDHNGVWVEIYGPGLSISITVFGTGVAYHWPDHFTKDEAEHAGAVEFCELKELECTRIINEVNRRLPT